MDSNIFSTARRILLDPAGLPVEALEKAVTGLRERELDFGDIFLERTVSESFALEEGLVKSGSFDVSQGAGIRAVCGEKTGFAYTEVLDRESVTAAVKAARTIRSGHECKACHHKSRTFSATQPLYPADDPLHYLERSRKKAILELCDRMARSLDPRVRQVMAGLRTVQRTMMLFTTDDFRGADIKPMVQLTVNVTLESHGRTEFGFAAAGQAGMPDIFTDEAVIALCKEAVHAASVRLEAEESPAGTMPVVLASGWPGVLVHEAVGHGLEGDFNRTGSSNYSRRLNEQVASPACTIVDDGTIPGRRGSQTFDDEGTATQHTVLIENGVLKNYMQDRQNAMLMKMKPTGNGRREGFNCLPLPRMTNTYMMPGKYDPQEIIASVDKGLYAVNFSGGQVDITSGNFVFSTSEAYLIENGKVTRPVKGATLIGNGPEIMQRVSMVGSDLAFDHGIGVCGKAGQSVPVGIGLPTVKIDNITVGGSKTA